MKIILNIITILLIALNCKAQTIINLKDDDGYSRNNANNYYKDIDNLLNPFEGTYIYSTGTDTLKIILKKQIMVYDGRNYNDELIGEYQYIKNRIEIFNTLVNIDDVNFNGKHEIDANNIAQFGGGHFCKGCVPGEIRLFGVISDINGNYGQLTIKKLTVNNQPAIEINISWELRYRRETDPPVPSWKIYPKDYILIKQ